MKQTICRRLSAWAMAVVLILSMVPAVAAVEGEIVITVDPPALELTVGETATISATVKQGDQVLSDAKVNYAVAAADIDRVKVDPESGEVKALAAGSAEIKAIYLVEDRSYEGICRVTIQPAVPANGVTITPVSNPYKEVGDTVQMIARVTPDEATDKTVTWKSKDSEVARIDSTGLIQFLEPGVTQITAETDNGFVSNMVEMTVSGLKMRDTMELLVGKSDTLTVSGPFGHAEGQSIIWSSSNISVADVRDGMVSAYNPGTAEITAVAGNYKAKCVVTVKEDVASAITGEMRVGEVFAFSDILSELNSKSIEMIDTRLEYVSGLSVDPRQGILYYGYSSPDVPGSGVGGLESYYVSGASHQRRLTDVVFVPSSDFGGTAVIHYTGHGHGKMFSGTIRLEVENTEDVAYNTAENRALHFDAETFSHVYQAKTGRVLSYVTFQLPSSNKGTLYYNYSETGQYSQRVSSQSRYYVTGGSILLENVCFLPAEGYTGVVTIPYQGTDTSGFSHSGKITITVYGESQQGNGDITYQTSAGGTVRFDADDFQNVCRDLTGTSLNYIYISQPSASKGKLYYQYVNHSNYDHVISDTTRYFRSSSPRISYIDFVAADGMNGTVSIPYTGYGSTGEKFEGEVLIRVSGESGGNIHYSTTAGRPVDFSGLDFQEACQSSNGAAMDYVRFELPSSRQGTLYYQYSSSGSPGSRVSERDQYTSSTLSKVTFVPNSGFTGTVSIPFSGYDVRGSRFSGTVEISVDAAVVDETITYNTVSGGAVQFDTGDFDRVCRSITGERLNYVRFQLPSSSKGTLYYQYDAKRGTGSSVNSSTSYYRTGSSRLLSDVWFVADQKYSGTVEISYDGKSTDGETFDGVVRIVIGDNRPGKLIYRGSSLPVKFKSADFSNACGMALSAPLSYVEFQTIPNSVYGKLMVNDHDRSAVTKVTTSSRYYHVESPYIDEIFFVAKAGFQGVVPISYKAVDTRGNSVTGSIEIQISNQNLKTHFQDLGHYAWAAPSIEFLYSGGVVNGYNSTTYGPAGKTSRGAFVMMICRLFDFQMRNGASFQDVPTDSVYASAVRTAKDLGIVNGDHGYFYPKRAITRQQAVVMLERAMRVAGWNVTSAPAAVLDGYADGKQVSDYARNAMASMIRMGVVQGDTHGNLNPHKEITRAEMAVMLHRLLTA